MSFPATRFSLPHVGAARNQGPGSAASADSQIDILLWDSQPGYRTVHTNDVPHLQRGDLQGFPAASAALANARTPHDRRTRQCSISSPNGPGRLPAAPRSTAAPAVPAALQHATASDRESVEAGSAPGHSQSLLRHVARSAESRQRLLRSLAPAQQSAASTIRHYLRRCV